MYSLKTCSLPKNNINFHINTPITSINKVVINPLSANFTKWSNTLKQFVGKSLTNYLSVFDYFVGLAFKGLMNNCKEIIEYIPAYYCLLCFSKDQIESLCLS